MCLSSVLTPTLIKCHMFYQLTLYRSNTKHGQIWLSVIPTRDGDREIQSADGQIGARSLSAVNNHDRHLLIPALTAQNPRHTHTHRERERERERERNTERERERERERNKYTQRERQRERERERERERDRELGQI